MAEAAEGRFLGFLHSFLRFWHAMREPKRKTISRMLPRLDGRIRAPRRSFGGSSEGRLAFIFGEFRPGPSQTGIRMGPMGIHMDLYGSDRHPYGSVWSLLVPSWFPIGSLLVPYWFPIGSLLVPDLFPIASLLLPYWFPDLGAPDLGAKASKSK